MDHMVVEASLRIGNPQKHPLGPREGVVSGLSFDLVHEQTTVDIVNPTQTAYENRKADRGTKRDLVRRQGAPHTPPPPPSSLGPQGETIFIEGAGFPVKEAVMSSSVRRPDRREPVFPAPGGQNTDSGAGEAATAEARRS